MKYHKTKLNYTLSRQDEKGRWETFEEPAYLLVANGKIICPVCFLPLASQREEACDACRTVIHTARGESGHGCRPKESWLKGSGAALYFRCADCEELG